MRFTPQTARENAAKSHVVRKANFLALRQAVKAQPAPPQGEIAVAADDASPDAFLQARLARVRMQLNRLDTLIEIETDPAKIDKLASATARLAEQERQLAGRPLPGSLRPSAPPKRTMFDGLTPKARPQLEQNGESERAEQE